MIAVAQLGARMHYAVPRILLENDLLDVCYTDLYSRKGILMLSQWWPFRWAKPVQTLRTRQHPALPAGRVRHFPTFGLAYVTGRDRCLTPEKRMRHFIRGGQHFNRAILKKLDKQLPAALYTFNSAGLELMQYAKERGVRLIHEQTIALHSIERQLLLHEQEKHPDWATNSVFGVASAAYSDREQAELALADVIVCGSAFVRQGIIQSGLSANSIYVVAYGVDLIRQPAKTGRLRRSGEPLRVLTVGEVGLRKGSPYVLQAARQLVGLAQFRMVGDYSRVPPTVLADLHEHVELTGQLSRTEVAGHYDWADVFLLPSVCEGSATATYEAMQYGLPLVVTANTGSLVTHGHEGYVVPVGDAEGIVSCLSQLATDDSLRNAMAARAKQTATVASYEAYSHRLVSLLRTVL